MYNKLVSIYQSPDWSEVEINWTAGLPANRLFQDHELPLNKDARYAMSVSTPSVKTFIYGLELSLCSQSGHSLRLNQRLHS